MPLNVNHRPSPQARHLRAAALLALGALVVHQGRYILGYGGGWREIFNKTGHEYFSLLVPLVLAMVLVGIVLFGVELKRAASAVSAGSRARPWSFVRSWLVGYAALCAIYTAQELSEGLLSGEHPASIAGLLANGGWIAFALALGVAALIALVLRGAAVALARGSRSGRVAPDRRPVLRPKAHLLPRSRPVGRNLAPRGPPAGLL
jgi:hypothetical protein